LAVSPGLTVLLAGWFIIDGGAGVGVGVAVGIGVGVGVGFGVPLTINLALSVTARVSESIIPEVTNGERSTVDVRTQYWMAVPEG
jgi:O-antigen ligase